MYSVFTGGCNTWHPNTYVMSRPNGVPNCVLLIIKTHSKFTIKNEVHEIQPRTGIIIGANTPYSYFNPYGEYMDDWLHFQPLENGHFSKSGIVVNEFFPLSNTHRFTTYIQQVLYENLYAPENFKEENVNCLMHTLINNVASAYQAKDNFSPSNVYYEQLKEMRLNIQHAPYHDISIQSMADKIGISISHFQHLYTNLFGISFQKDLIRMRIASAQNILITTDLSIEQVAQMCGYSNTVHFYRQFREISRMTPNEYRKSH